MNEYLRENALTLLSGLAFDKIPDNYLDEIIISFSSVPTDAISELAGRKNPSPSDEPIKTHMDRVLEYVEINIEDRKRFYGFINK